MPYLSPRQVETGAGHAAVSDSLDWRLQIEQKEESRILGFQGSSGGQSGFGQFRCMP
jgi:hypothetical protein